MLIKKGLYKIGTIQGKLNSCYVRNKFSTFTKEIVNFHYLVGKATSAAAAGHLDEITHVLAENLRYIFYSKCHNSLSFSNK